MEPPKLSLEDDFPIGQFTFGFHVEFGEFRILGQITSQPLVWGKH